MTCSTGCRCSSEDDRSLMSNAQAMPSECAGRTGGTMRGITLAQLALMLCYPDEQFHSKLDGLTDSIGSVYPEALKPFKRFCELSKASSLAELEELYTRTFDLAAIASPYITGYIYGDENYDRGTLMACLSENYSRLGFELEGELPDHLALLLRFSSWLDEETLDELIEYCLREPVAQMCEQLRNSDNMYFFLLSAISAVLNSAQRGDSHK
ncbi:MAG: molecular chaperone TorD family protein [Candidatus Obscuribacterales bacterium]|nr:molecular chaperone TorD family protein [Candidatus Obscuribacterales bacterium]